MASILTKKKKIEALDTDKIIQDVMVGAEDAMADLNAEQINSGMRADGELMPDYSIRSVIQYGKPYGPIRLRETGAFQAGMYAKVTGDKIEFSSSDSKNNMLVERYGKEIEGLSEKYKLEVMRDNIRPGFKQKIFDSIGLIMKK